jgi:hypothetical protein
MTIENGTEFVLAYLLVSIGVIVAFVGAVFMVGWFIGRRHERRRAENSNPPRRAGLRRGSPCGASGWWIDSFANCCSPLGLPHLTMCQYRLRLKQRMALSPASKQSVTLLRARIEFTH